MSSMGNKIRITTREYKLRFELLGPTGNVLHKSSDFDDYAELLRVGKRMLAAWDGATAMAIIATEVAVTEEQWNLITKGEDESHEEAD